MSDKTEEKQLRSFLLRTSFKNVSGNWQFNGNMTPERSYKIFRDIENQELASLREQLKIEKENNANAVKFIGDLNAQLKQKEDENRDLKDKIKCALVLIASKPDEDVKMAYDVLDKTRQ